MKFFASLAVLALVSGCGTDAANTAETVSLISAKLTAASNIVGETTRRNPTAAARAGIDSVWTTSPGVAPLSGSGQSSLQTWMENMFDPTFVNSSGAKVTFVGRIANSLDVFCFLSELTDNPDDTGLPSNGTYPITFTQAAVDTCKGEAEMVGGTATLTVESPSDTTYYDKKITAELSSRETCPFIFLARINSDVVNVATSEDQSCDGRDQVSRTIFWYDAATQRSRFTYISQNFSENSGHEFYRGFLDEGTDEAYVLGHYGSANGGNITGGVSFTAVGKPSAGGTVAVSAKSAGNTIAGGTYDGCINISGNDVATDNTLACTLTGTSISTAYNVVTGTHGLYSEIADLYPASPTEVVGFTDSTDIFTFAR